jgi:UDPglucose 6-dehydrogenase
MLIYLTSSTEAELVKYMANSFLATKVSMMNEFKILSDVLNLDWNSVLKSFVSDIRIGSSHTEVPGPDGLNGYGGSCFPKDVNAIIKYAAEQGVRLSVIEAG